MIGRILTAYKVELMKAFRTKSTYVGPVLAVLAVLASLLVHPIERDSISDYQFIAYATQVSMGLLGLLLILAYGSSLVSTELSSGTARTVLVRPLRRREFLAAKLMLGFTYAAGLTVLVAASSWLLALGMGELNGVSYGGDIVYTASEMFKTYLLGMVLAMAPQCAAVAYAVMFSTCTRNTGAAMAASIGAWLIVDSVKYPLGAAPYLFTSYFEMPWSVFAKHSDNLDASWTEAQPCLIASLSSLVLFTCIAIYAFNRRNLQT